MSRFPHYVKAATVVISLALAAPASEAADIVDTAAAAGSFGTLLSAAQAAGIADQLRGPGPMTLFAPTDEAFAKLPPGTLDRLSQNPEMLRSVLTYHVVPAAVDADALRNTVGQLPTLQGTPLEYNGLSEALEPDTVEAEELDFATQVALPSPTLLVNDAQILNPGVAADNGIVYPINAVLFPEDLLWPIFVGEGEPDYIDPE